MPAKNKKQVNKHRNNHPLWTYFVKWAGDNGVNLEHFLDWNVWWECFLAGANAFDSETGGK